MRTSSWAVLVGGSVVALAAAAWLGAPWLACRWLDARCPWPVAERFSLAGAAMREGGPEAPALRLDAGAGAVRLAAAAEGVPGWCIAPGQRVWGFADHDLPWLAVVDDRADAPSLAVRLAPERASALLAGLGAGQGWSARLDRLRLATRPGTGDGVVRLDLEASGAVQSAALVRYGVPAGAWVPVEAVEAEAEARLVEGRPSLRVRVRRARVVLMGMSMEVGRWIEPVANRRIAEALDGRVLPPGTPWPVRLEAAVGE